MGRENGAYRLSFPSHIIINDFPRAIRCSEGKDYRLLLRGPNSVGMVVFILVSRRGAFFLLSGSTETSVFDEGKLIDYALDIVLQD